MSEISTTDIEREAGDDAAVGSAAVGTQGAVDDGASVTPDRDDSGAGAGAGAGADADASADAGAGGLADGAAAEGASAVAGNTDDAAPEEANGHALEDEGDIAADYIEELLDICDLDGDIDIDARGGRAYVSVNSSEDSNLRLLSQPDTVQALQELTRLAVQTKTGGFSRLILDVGGSRKLREAELARLVGSAIDRIEVGGEVSVAFAPMSSYERKVVHDIVAERGFVSNSEGEGRDRHTVITAS